MGVALEVATPIMEEEVEIKEKRFQVPSSKHEDYLLIPKSMTLWTSLLISM